MAVKSTETTSIKNDGREPRLRFREKGEERKGRERDGMGRRGMIVFGWCAVFVL